MSRSTIVFTLLIILGVCSFSATRLDEILPASAGMGLKGNVKKLTMCHYDWNGSIADSTIVEFNKSGMVTAVSKFPFGGARPPQAVEKFSYAGSELVSHVVFNHGYREDSVVYRCKDGLPAEAYSCYSKCTTFYEYRKRQLVREIQLDRKKDTLYIFTYNGNPSDGQSSEEKEYRSNGKSTRQELYSFWDEKGRLKMDSVPAQGNYPAYRTEYFYDMRNNAVKKMTSSGATKMMERTVYTYDQQGNWIKAEQFSGYWKEGEFNERQGFTIYHHIEYY